MQTHATGYHNHNTQSEKRKKRSKAKQANKRNKRKHVSILVDISKQPHIDMTPYNLTSPSTHCKYYLSATSPKQHITKKLSIDIGNKHRGEK